MQSEHYEMRLTGADVLLNGEIVDDAITVANGLISRDMAPEVDLEGYVVLPGIIDLHGDCFERHMAPRPTAPFPMRTGLVGTDRDAAANGVTTAWMAQSWSWEGGARAPQYAIDLLQAHAAYKPHMLSDLRIQLRVETHTMDTQELLIETIDRFKIGYAIFNNHLPEAFAAAIDNPAMIEGWAQKAGRTAEEHMDLVRTAYDREREVPRYLCNLATAFDRMGVRYGSHDDPDGATRERFSMIGAKVCEFPTALGAAYVARAWEEPIIMGAPNVVRGGSQSGNASAADLIAEGCCDALVSDYYYPALAQAAFRLSDDGLMPFAKAWGMISTKPASIMGLKDRGLIAPGLRADLTIIDAETRLIEGTMVAGRWTHLCGGLASRIVANPKALYVAAE